MSSALVRSAGTASTSTPVSRADLLRGRLQLRLVRAQIVTFAPSLRERQRGGLAETLARSGDERDPVRSGRGPCALVRRVARLEHEDLDVPIGASPIGVEPLVVALRGPPQLIPLGALGDARGHGFASAPDLDLGLGGGEQVERPRGRLVVARVGADDDDVPTAREGRARGSRGEVPTADLWS